MLNFTRVSGQFGRSRPKTRPIWPPISVAEMVTRAVSVKSKGNLLSILGGLLNLQKLPNWWLKSNKSYSPKRLDEVVSMAFFVGMEG